ncbi:hypothetical protein ACFX2J_013177 [Malus domestica]
MLELTSTKQWKDEPVVNYISMWRSLSLDCKDQISETFTIEMCVRGMHWGLYYIIQGIKLRTFEELATRSYDMKLSIANHGKKELITDLKKDNVLAPKVDKIGKKPTNEAFIVHTTPIKKSFTPKTYPFPDSDVAAMLDDLLEKKVIELPECKHPEEMNRINDPKYCKYHRIVSYLVGKCFVFKELIMKLSQQGKIELDLEGTTTTYTTMITFESFDPVPLQTRKPGPQATWLKVEHRRKHHHHNNRKPKRSIKAAKLTYIGEPIEQEPHIPVSLHEYFSKDLFQQCTTTACHMVEVEIEEPLKGNAIAIEEEKTLMPKESLPTHFSIKEALRLPKKM